MSTINIPLLCSRSNQWFELPNFRINFYGPKDVRAIEILHFLTIATDEQPSINIIDLYSTKTYVVDIH